MTGKLRRLRACAECLPQPQADGASGRLKRATDEDGRNLLEDVTDCRAAAIEALDVIRAEAKMNMIPLQEEAREVWDGRECGDRLRALGPNGLRGSAG